MKKIKFAYKSIGSIIEKALKMEQENSESIAMIHPNHRQSASNLVHYLALRSFDTSQLQEVLRDLGFSSLTSIEGHVLMSLFNIRNLLALVLGKDQKKILLIDTLLPF